MSGLSDFNFWNMVNSILFFITSHSSYRRLAMRLVPSAARAPLDRSPPPRPLYILSILSNTITIEGSGDSGVLLLCCFAVVVAMLGGEESRQDVGEWFELISSHFLFYRNSMVTAGPV